MRLIDADAVAEAINDEIEIAAEMGTHEANVCKSGLMMALAYVNTAQTVDAAPCWIPCEERLPEESGLYLVTTTDGDVYEAYIDAILHLWSRFESYGFYILDNVDAWMPLPEPYGAERKDDE